MPTAVPAAFHARPPVECPPPPGPSRDVGRRHLSHFLLGRELYCGKCSRLNVATHQPSGQEVALKLYRKDRLSELNRWGQSRLPPQGGANYLPRGTGEGRGGEAGVDRGHGRRPSRLAKLSASQEA